MHSNEESEADSEENEDIMGGRTSKEKVKNVAASDEESKSSEEEVTFSTSASSSDASGPNGGKRKATKDSWKYRRRKKEVLETSDEEMYEGMEVKHLRRTSQLSSSSSSSSSSDSSFANESSDHLGTRSWSKQSTRRVSGVSNGNDASHANSNKLLNGRRSEKHMDEHTFKLLTDFYRVNPYPTKKEFRQLEKTTGMTPKRLMYWFSNRRRRDGTAVRREKKEYAFNGEDANERVLEQTSEEHQNSPVVERKKKRKGRPTGLVSHFEDRPRQILLEFYLSKPFPTSEDLTALTESTGLERKKVRHFFSHRRAKEGLKSFEDKTFAEKTLEDKFNEETVPNKKETEEDGDCGEAIGTLDSFACLIRECDYSTHCRWNLTRHLRGNHEIDPWACKQCFRFYRPEKAQSHECSPRKRKKRIIKEIKMKKRLLPKSLPQSKGDGSLKDLMGTLLRPPMGKKVAEEPGVDSAMASNAENALFRRSRGTLEVVMVNGDQYDAVQRYIRGTNMVRIRPMVNMSL